MNPTVKPLFFHLAFLKRIFFFSMLTLLAAITAGCATPGGLKKPTMEVTEVRIAGFDRESIQLTVLMRVQNPNPVEISLTDIEAKLFIADQELAKAESTQAKVVLPASGSLLLPMRVTVPYKTLPDALQKSITKIISGGIPYKIVGSVTTFNGLLTVPFEKTGEIAKRR